MTLIVLIFCLHTAAIVGRLIISGRPPVTNLYSSAVFIGWGCVVLGMGLEMIFRLGIGNIVSSIAGFTTLLIASWLAVDGDTFTVLQAVLDTQFWLATHVTSITIGYSATFMAGLVGICLLVASVIMSFLVAKDQLPSHEQQNVLKLMGKMVYGIVCFATFFSFVGTVLGGLWADDSWGRFWGWDPKENGALMIVLWNSLVLHARWDRQVGDRGLAVLAIGGNIITAWSWFGVNELGAGLHSYGFTEGRSFWLGIVVLAHLALMVGGTVLAYVQRPRTIEAEVA
jgi:ABC-type transport system involved in cytochrome c biogenesis permease subunit